MSDFETHPVGTQARLKAMEAQIERLEPLARRCLHLAFVWNDHNFPDADVMAMKEAKKAGIHTLEQANDFLLSIKEAARDDD